jgi:hypothetical protein
MREFKLLRGYQEINPLTNIDWDTINRINDLNTIITPYTPHWNGINYTPSWVVNPGLITYTPQPYTITTTPGYGTFTIPSYGTITTGTATTSTLTTSNPNGITYTTGGFGGTLTTGTANTFYTSNIK